VLTEIAGDERESSAVRKAAREAMESILKSPKDQLK